MWWTFFMIMPWLLVGASIDSKEKDYIFKKVRHEKVLVQPALATASALDGSQA